MSLLCYRRIPMLGRVLILCLLFGCSAALAVARQNDEPPDTPENQLLAAITARDVERVRAFLQSGVSPNTPSGIKFPPLVAAAEATGRDPAALQILRLLLDYRADVHATDERGNTALMAAAASEVDTFPDVHNGQEIIIKAIGLLLERKATINTLNEDHDTALSLAMRRDHQRVVRALLERGADAQETGKANFTPLHYAAFADMADRVKALLQAGADVNAANAYGETPLMFAAEGASLEMVKLLLEAGANVRAKVGSAEGSGDTALSRALEHNEPEVALLLVNNGADVNTSNSYGVPPLVKALHLTVGGKRPRSFVDEQVFVPRVDKLIAALLEKGANVNPVSKYDSSPLILAIMYDRSLRNTKHTNWTKPLLERGANVNERSVRYPGTALFAAMDTHRNNLDVPRLLLDYDADVNAINHMGQTILLETLGYHQQDFPFARLLIEKGAKVECYDNVRKTPLLWAAYHGRLDLVKMLLERGADPFARDLMGQDALRLAYKGKRPPVVTFLKQYLSQLRPSTGG